MAPPNILVIDDEVANLTLLTAMLEKHGYEVRPVISGEKALAAVRKCAPDLVLLDILMPEMNGYEVCAAFKADEVLQDIPIVFLSALHSTEEKVKAFAVGGVDYITKPFQAEEVLARINTHLALRKTQKTLQEQKIRFQTEIAERKRAEESLHQSEQRLRRIVENMPVMLDAFDDAGTIVFWNRECEQVTGYLAEEMVGNSHAIELLYPDETYREQMYAEMEELGHGFRNEEWKLTCKDGTIKTISWSNISQFCPIPGWSFWAVGIDVTERKHAETALLDHEERYQALIRTAMDGFWVVDMEGRFLEVDDVYCSMSGYSREALLSMRIQDIEVAESPEMVAQHIQKVITEGWDRFESRHRRVDGTVFDVEISTVYLTAQKKFLVFARDITNRKRAEDQLQQMLREKTALLQEIHHRVKSNLQAVSSLLYLQAEKTKHAETRKILQESRDRVLSMALVHEQLYASENLANIDMARYIEELATNLYYSYQVDIERIRLNFDIESLMLSIEQAVPCGLLIQELVSNAIKHAFPNEESGTIFIRFHKQEEQLRLIVRNTGIPFPREIDIEHADTMGLDLINTFVQQLQGTLELDRDGGTTFSVAFPKPLTMNT